ncbi:ribonuclease P protein component [Marinobacterium arenosum]|uniref:ribonuclease P protein component n=1 Tax=Marinobacterium arenosum TaxID=2862496 RepID=UPI001C945882|nr:ribonuclease P protein component [Marinobacterium arenosum]MBY4676576.1 ribonuclease P protein component [Marinobacterium arenosum]
MAEFEYPRQLRILTGGGFKSVFNNVTLKVPDQHILLLATPNGLSHPRIGFVISKKNVRRAVKRNRVRRIMRESFRLNQHQLPAVDILVLARPGLGELEKDELHRLAKKCWSRLRKKAQKSLK